MNSVKVRKKFTVAVTATAENEAEALGHLMNELNRLNQPQPAVVVPIEKNYSKLEVVRLIRSAMKSLASDASLLDVKAFVERNGYVS